MSSRFAMQVDIRTGCGQTNAQGGLAKLLDNVTEFGYAMRMQDVY